MRLLKFLTLFCSLMVVANSQAASWYRVEVMLVAYSNEEQLSLESWPVSLSPNLSVTSSATPYSWWNNLSINQYNALFSSFEFPQTPEDRFSGVLKPLDELELQEAIKHLSKRHDMQIIWHKAWLEPIQERNKSIVHPLHIDNSTSLFDFSLTGNFSLSISRYLHITTDLVMQHFDHEGQPLRAAQIQQSRRMRSGELHYLDHPMLGIFIKISPTPNGS